jgi:hypothetical protein
VVIALSATTKNWSKSSVATTHALADPVVDSKNAVSKARAFVDRNYYTRD